MRVAVTGGSGLLGAPAVTTLLDRGHEVTSFDIDPSSRHPAETRIVDIRDRERLITQLAGFDAVVHTASIVDLHLGTPTNLDEINVAGARNVVGACKANGIGRLCYVSSAEAITGMAPIRRLAENEAIYPRPHLSHYGATKEQAERLILEANGPNLATCATRTYGLFGEGDRTVVPLYLQRLPTKKIRLIGRANARTDVVYAPNVAHALALLVEKIDPSVSWAGTAFHLTDAETVNIQRFLADLVAPLGYRLDDRWSIPPVIAESAAQLSEVRYRLTGAERWARPSLTNHRLRLALVDCHLDSSRARSELGYRPPFDRATAIERTQEWLTGAEGLPAAR